jgi:hypothetical protein
VDKTVEQAGPGYDAAPRIISKPRIRTVHVPKTHRAGKDAEAAQLQDLFKDPTVVFVYEETKPNNTWVDAFKNMDHGYWVFQVMRHSEHEVAGREMWVRKKDDTRVTIDDFRNERAGTAP